MSPYAAKAKAQHDRAEQRVILARRELARFKTRYTIGNAQDARTLGRLEENVSRALADLAHAERALQIADPLLP